jgi:GMP synthase-like glutamine amidotransferase
LCYEADTKFMDGNHVRQSGGQTPDSKCTSHGKRIARHFVHVIQHNDDGIGRAAELPFTVRIHRSDLDSNVPELGEAAGLVVLGGPQTSFEEFPSRDGELRLIRQAIDAGIPVLAICLGAQLLSLATGGSTYRREQPEDGWFPVSLSEMGERDPLFRGCPDVFVPRSHHRDSFEMPPGAVRLASSEQCVEQGYRLGDRVWGLQFHMETTSGHGRPVEWEMTSQQIDEQETRITRLQPVGSRIFRNCADVIMSTLPARVPAAAALVG